MNSPFDKFADATLEDIASDPKKFGAPTFEEFKKNREAFMGRGDEWLAAVDKGSELLGRHVKKHIYILKGNRVKSLEQLDRIARDMGLDPFKLIPHPQVVDIGGGWCNLEITFKTGDGEHGKKTSP